MGHTGRVSRWLGFPPLSAQPHEPLWGTQDTPADDRAQGTRRVALAGEGAQALPEEVLTHAEVLLAPPAQDVDELRLVRAPFQLAGFQQVLVAWGRGQRGMERGWRGDGEGLSQGAARTGLCPRCPPPFAAQALGRAVPPAPSLPGWHPRSLTLASCSTRSSLTTSSSSLVPCGTATGSALPGSGPRCRQGPDRRTYLEQNHEHLLEVSRRVSDDVGLQVSLVGWWKRER